MELTRVNGSGEVVASVRYDEETLRIEIELEQGFVNDPVIGFAKIIEALRQELRHHWEH